MSVRPAPPFRKAPGRRGGVGGHGRNGIPGVVLYLLHCSWLVRKAGRRLPESSRPLSGHLPGFSLIRNDRHTEFLAAWPCSGRGGRQEGKGRTRGCTSRSNLVRNGGLLRRIPPIAENACPMTSRSSKHAVHSDLFSSQPRSSPIMLHRRRPSLYSTPGIKSTEKIHEPLRT